MFEKKDFKSYELHDFVYGVVSAISQAKNQVDLTSIRERQKLEEEVGASLLSTLIPPTTFKIEEVEINLKYLIEPLDKGDKPLNDDGTPRIKIVPYSEKLSSSDSSIQTLKFKLTPMVLKKYDVAGETKLKYE
ncbi:MAG: hypothetical protein KGI33_07350 [Thaumarchaeota archaeon]|nr:hypothetical protein [Nitrososphaerota archaeon]